jgi:hypothetical protein
VVLIPPTRKATPPTKVAAVFTEIGGGQLSELSLDRQGREVLRNPCETFDEAAFQKHGIQLGVEGEEGAPAMTWNAFHRGVRPLTRGSTRACWRGRGPPGASGCAFGPAAAGCAAASLRSRLTNGRRP